VCSSSAEALLDDGSSSLLIDYASADHDTRMHLVGLGANGQMAFEYVYGTRDCGTGWNAQPIPFEAMSFD
jgi:arylsulfate sulfotransferase